MISKTGKLQDDIMKGMIKTTSALTLCLCALWSASIHADMDKSKPNTSDLNSTPPLEIQGKNPFSVGDTQPKVSAEKAVQKNKPLVHAEVTIQDQILVLHENYLLSQEVKVWAEKVGYKMLWNSDSDYILYSTIVLSGKTNDEILNELGNIFFSENYGLIIKFYSKNKVLIIDEQ
jgi:toxin co-regulated pilus biosynthesis protein Q